MKASGARNCCLAVAGLFLPIVIGILLCLLIVLAEEYYNRSNFILSYQGAVTGEEKGDRTLFIPCDTAQRHYLGISASPEASWLNIFLPTNASSGTHPLRRVNIAKQEYTTLVPDGEYAIIGTIVSNIPRYSFDASNLVEGTITLEETPTGHKRIHGHLEATFHDPKQGDLELRATFNFRIKDDLPATCPPYFG